MKSSKSLLLLIAVVAGLGAAIGSVFAASPDDLVPLCYRNRVIQVPSYLVSRYIFKGANTNIVNCELTPQQ